MSDPKEMREEYARSRLDKADVGTDPIVFFQKWFQQAVDSAVPEPNAMILGTVSPDAQPSSRTVLMKGINSDGFQFYSNYESRKGKELAGNPRASLLFLWKELERQVCIRGRVEKLSRAEAEAYFKSRPYGSRIGAWASTQSAPIPNRAFLEKLAHELSDQHPEAQGVPLPDFWGGYLLRPDWIEFWQGRPSRLHDRIAFSRDLEDAGGQHSPAKAWDISRLSP